MEIEYFIAPDDDVWPVEHQKWIDGCGIPCVCDIHTHMLVHDDMRTCVLEQSSSQRHTAPHAYYTQMRTAAVGLMTVGDDGW